MKILNYNGHIPPIPAVGNYTGFYPSASSELVTNPSILAFNPTSLSTSFNNGIYWIPNSFTNAWIQIECPTPVRIWKITLGGSSAITSWKISVKVSSSDAFTDLLTPNNRMTRIQGNYTVDSTTAYKIYRLIIVTARLTVIKVNHFQIYTYFKDGD